MMPFGYNSKSGCECNKSICFKQIRQAKEKRNWKKEEIDDNRKVYALGCSLYSSIFIDYE
jgi:hypothetical protein